MISQHASFIGHLCGIFVGFMYVVGIFNPIFKITDSLGINQIFDRLQEQYNYDRNAPPPQQQGMGMGGMRGMGGFGRMAGMGRMGGFRRGYY